MVPVLVSVWLAGSRTSRTLRRTMRVRTPGVALRPVLLPAIRPIVAFLSRPMRADEKQMNPAARMLPPDDRRFQPVRRRHTRGPGM